jgi:TatD DNase family protein
MQLIDIGVNLMSPSFDRDREEVLAAAERAGVSPLIITGSSLESSEAARDFAASRKRRCRSTAGVHPHNAKTWNDAAAARLRELIAQPALSAVASTVVASSTVVAVGECGLDYNRNFSPPEAQRKCFEDQLVLAAELGKPVFLHERDAFADFSAILKNCRSRLTGAVVHCFSGGARELETYLELDCHIGITGWICDERRGSHLIPLVTRIPADRLLLETDAPYLLPRNLPRSSPLVAGISGAAKPRSGRNEPRFLPHIAACVAQAAGKEPERLAAETSANAIRFFGM